MKLKSFLSKMNSIAVPSIFILVTFFQNQEVLINGRFFAEEGSMYWAHSLSSNLLEQLFFVAPVAGYYLLNANIQTLLASIVPLSIAPFLTIYSSALITYSPIYLLRKYSLSVMKNSRAIFISIILILAPVFSIKEIALNSINSQIFLAMGVVILISTQPQISNIFESIFVNLYLFVAFFSGWYSLVFIPIAILKSLLGHSSRINRSILAWGGAGLVVQLLSFLYAYKNEILWPNRFEKEFTINLFISFFSKIIDFSLFGFVHLPAYLKFILILLFGVFFLWNYIKGNYTRYNLIELSYLSLIFFLLFIFIIIGQAGQYMGGRYIALPSFIVLLLFIKLCSIKKQNLFSLFSIGIILLIYSHSMILSSKEPYCEVECQKWSDAVRSFSSDKSYIVYHWPITDEKNWFTDLANPKVQLAPFQELGLK